MAHQPSTTENIDSLTRYTENMMVLRMTIRKLQPCIIGDTHMSAFVIGFIEELGELFPGLTSLRHFNFGILKSFNIIILYYNINKNEEETVGVFLLIFL